MINLPSQEKKWVQANQSDLFGNIHVTKNITFDTEGYLRLSYSPRAAMDESIDADFDNPAVILFNSDYGYFVATWDQAFEANTNILEVRPTQIATAGVPSTDTQSDAVWFGGLMPVSQDTDLDYYSLAANTWTDTNISLTASGQHPLEVMFNMAALAVADVNTVKLYANPLTATPTLLTTLTIMSEFRITGMCYFNQNLYIATQNVNGGHALLYVWNGQGTSVGAAAQQSYEVDSNIIFDVCVHQDAVVLVTGNGSLLQFNGAGFTMLDAFPLFYTDQALTDETNIGMYHNMLKSNGELLYINFTNQENDTDRLLDQPDGIWCYDPRVGLYNRYSLSNALVKIPSIANTDVNTTTDQITVPTPGYVTGTEMVFNEVFGLAPLVDGTRYFAIRIDATHIQLATTLANAVAGTAIDLTSTGASNTFTVYQNIDYGQYFNERTMAIYPIERPVANRKYGTDLLWGAEVIRRDNTGDYATLGTVARGISTRGWFVTPKIFSENVTDNFDLFTLKFTKFEDDTCKIVVKYRTTDDNLNYIKLADWDITWTSSTTFTSTETGWANAVVGNEVNVLNGAAGGLLAHITAISEASGTYTITIDETYNDYISGDVSRAVFRNWIKWKEIDYDSSEAGQCFISEHIGQSGKWLQLKVELRGVNTRIEEMKVDNIYRLPATDK